MITVICLTLLAVLAAYSGIGAVCRIAGLASAEEGRPVQRADVRPL